MTLTNVLSGLFEFAHPEKIPALEQKFYIHADGRGLRPSFEMFNDFYNRHEFYGIQEKTETKVLHEGKLLQI